jgi:type I restriction enzyme S subunit
MTVWPVKTLGEVCEIYQPQTIGMKDMVSDGPYVVYGANGPIGRYDRFNHENSEVTVTCRGATCGTVNVTPPQVWITGNAMVVRPNEAEISKLLLKYWLEGLDFSSVITGAAQPQITRTTLSPMKIPVPPLEEQKRIVALLDDATARVAELTACYEHARTHANDLFASALRDALERNQSAPLRTLDELCEEGIVKLGRGNIISKKDIAAKPGSYPIYSSARENEGKFGEYGEYMFDEEMITWSIDGGGRLFYRSKHKFSVTNVGGTLRVLDAQILDIQYLHRVLQNLHSQRVFDWVFKAHPSVIRKVYDAIPMPPLEEQKQIVARLDSMRAKTTEMVAAYDAKLSAVKNLRQSILEAVFAGEL